MLCSFSCCSVRTASLPARSTFSSVLYISWRRQLAGDRRRSTFICTAACCSAHHSFHPVAHRAFGLGARGVSARWRCLTCEFVAVCHHIFILKLVLFQFIRLFAAACRCHNVTMNKLQVELYIYSMCIHLNLPEGQPAPEHTPSWSEIR